MANDPIKKANDGTYYFRAYLGVHPITRKAIHPYRSGFKTKKEAKNEYAKIMLTKMEDFAQPKDQETEMSFQDFIIYIYLPYYKTKVKESTFENRKPTIERHFPYFYKLKVSEIEPIHIQKWQIRE